ncbi:copper amine oxidase N-terminal domain-containing protein [Ammoniphilus sp. CFH 90114]|uniref:copper amine oxidase N-terminal domain-containing protein n=1 Tax=Ammoniphilus sp. CFH 90114 TaxID=2493665 RepID=UPI00100DA6C8|nr:copper amine oxidase N-terminal domain-containing protein [Ammoniphilus sp. CFH 90114]RXT04501.1 copper amine oxidase N-terminal domain-containing protein [Ammoniphilus sp. CFH 90114]
MKKINKKMINVVTTAALVASLAAPFAVSADSDNVITTVPSIADDYESEETSEGSKDYGKPVSQILIKEDNVEFTNGQIFRLTLPEGVKFVKDAYDKDKNTSLLATYLVGAKVETVTNQVLELSVDVDGKKLTDEMKVPFYVEVDGATGELKATLESMDTTLSPGTYTFAKVGDGNTTTTVEEVKKVSDSASSIATIRVDENSVNAMGSDKQSITFKLPSKFKWEEADIEFSSAFGGLTEVGSTEDADDVGAGEYHLKFNDNNLVLTFDPAGSRDQRGTIYIKNAKISAKDGASYGDVELNIDGDEVTESDIVIAKYTDFNTNVSVDGEPKELVAGRYIDDKDDMKLAKLKIKEDIAGSIIPGRKVKVELPTWVKAYDAELKDASEVTLTKAGITYNSDRNEIEFTIEKLSGKADFSIQFYSSIQADKTGDITAKVTSKAGIEGELVLGKAVAPVTVEATAAKVQIGLKEQDLSDIIITETAKGNIKEGWLTVALPENMKWAEEPKVEVLEGNLDIDDEVELDKTEDGKDNVVKIKVDSESSKASKIKISGGKLTLDRTVPYGAIEAKIGGSLIENSVDEIDEDKADERAMFEDKDYVAKVVLAEVITPAPAETAAVANFVIDSTTYKVDGVEKTADVAPYINNGRTFLPVRFVAEALGVTESNIIWNANTKTVTLIKGDRIAQMTIGSNKLIVNGVAVQMDAAAEIKDGRTTLPLRYAAQALGAEVEWDEATRTVTIKN